MVIEEIRKVGIAVALDVEDVKLLRDALLSLEPRFQNDTGIEGVKWAALSSMGAAFHASVVACEALPED